MTTVTRVVLAYLTNKIATQTLQTGLQAYKTLIMPLISLVA